MGRVYQPRRKRRIKTSGRIPCPILLRSSVKWVPAQCAKPTTDCKLNVAATGLLAGTTRWNIPCNAGLRFSALFSSYVAILSGVVCLLTWEPRVPAAYHKNPGPTLPCMVDVRTHAGSNCQISTFSSMDVQQVRARRQANVKLSSFHNPHQPAR